MDLQLLNSDFEVVAYLDRFISLIWMDRFCGNGEIEMIAVPGNTISNDFSDPQYVRFKDSEHLMIVEYYNLHCDIIDGDTLVIKGRSLESILDRRVIWHPLTITGDFQEGIKEILDDNMLVLDPVLPERHIPEMTFKHTTDMTITNLGISEQFSKGEGILDVITALCKAKNIGFKITLNSEHKFEFELYAGTDRSWAQTEHAFVVFSPDYDNLLASDYVKTNQLLKTVAYVGGEIGVGNIENTASVGAMGGSGAGLSRREMYFKSGLTKTTDTGELTDAEYEKLLQNRGITELTKFVEVELFDGEVAPYPYEFGVDYNMGDVVQTADLYGHSSRSRITEMLYSQNLEGFKLIPTFSKLIDDNIMRIDGIETGAIVVEAPTLG